MKKSKHILKGAVLAIAVAGCLATGGCAKGVDTARAPIPDAVWPPAPERPRIRFVHTVSKPEDLHIRPGAFRRFLDYFAGNKAPSMVTPYGVETDSAGRLYVVDTFLRTVHVFDEAGNTYHRFAVDESNLMSPIDIAIDDNRDRIYVSDSGGGAVKIFEDRGRRFVGEIGRGLLQRPTGVAVNAKTSELLIVDTRSAHVLRYDLEDHRLKGTFGGRGTGEGLLHYPTNLCVTDDGSVFVTDSLNFRIQKFSPEGKWKGGFGQAGDTPGSFARPRGVAVDSEGNIYVVDGLFDNIQIFDREFKLLMAFGRPGHEFGEFWLPAGIFIDPSDRIYVADSYNQRVQVFQYLREDEPKR